jgi:hypothetical protein
MSKRKLATTIEETKTKIIVFGWPGPFFVCRSASAKRSYMIEIACEKPIIILLYTATNEN